MHQATLGVYKDKTIFNDHATTQKDNTNGKSQDKAINTQKRNRHTRQDNHNTKDDQLRQDKGDWSLQDTIITKTREQNKIQICDP